MRSVLRQMASYVVFGNTQMFACGLICSISGTWGLVAGYKILDGQFAYKGIYERNY